jgi:hypothetical protein
MTIRRELIDELLKELAKAVIERCLEAELDTHLGYPKYGRKGRFACCFLGRAIFSSSLPRIHSSGN